jgi:enoyl-CoA hydratase/carnithine racemase
MSATVEIVNDIALIRMDDNKANAINFEMIAALNAPPRPKQKRLS